MTKIKMFFKDVIGELREPSEDSEKVMQTVRKLFAVMLFFEIIIRLISIVSILFNNDILKISFYNLIGLNMGLIGFIRFGIGYLNYLLSFIIYIYLFILMVKSIKRHEPVTNKIFIVMLILLVLLPLIRYIIGEYEFTFILWKFVQLLSESAIFYYSFFRIRAKEENSAEDKIRITNIIIAICILFAIFIVETLVNFLIYLPKHIKYIVNFYESNTMENFLYYLLPLINSMLAFLSLILVIILFFIFIEGIHFKPIHRKLINGLFVIYTIINIVMFFISGGNQSWFLIIIFLILSGYSNKSKLAEEFRKKFIVKVKTAIDHHFKFN